MDRKISWITGCHDEIELVYEKAEQIFGKHGNNGSLSFPLFPQSPENPVKSGYLEAMEIMEFYPDLLLIMMSLVRAQQWGSQKKARFGVLFSTLFAFGEFLRAQRVTPFCPRGGFLYCFAVILAFAELLCFAKYNTPEK